MNILKDIITIIFVFVVTLVLCGYAEEVGAESGFISGRVLIDEGKTPAAGAKVGVLPADYGSSLWLAETDERGFYIISGLHPGEYELMASLEGFVPARKKSIVVSGGRITPNIDFLLIESASISGKITHVDGVTPIEGVEVVGSRNQGDVFVVSTTSDSEGRFMLEGLIEGTFTVMVSKEGLSTESRNLDVRRGEEVVDLTLPMAQVASVTGIVYQFDSVTPIPDVEILAYGEGGAYSSTSNVQDGQYSIVNIAPGTYRIEAKKEGFVFPVLKNMIVVSGTTLTDANFVSFAGTIRGTVTSGSGPVSEANVSAVLRIGGDSNVAETLTVETTTNSAGYYEIDNLPKATYNVWALKEGYGRKIEVVQLTNDGEIVEVDFSLEAASSISGQVTDDTTHTSINEAVITLWDSQKAVSVNLYDEIRKTNDQGEFLLDKLSAGTYEILVEAQGYPMKRGPQIFLNAGESIENLALHLSSTVGSISGKVLAADVGSPIGNAFVIAIDESHDNTTFTESDGSYELKGVSPGSYQISVIATGFETVHRENVLVQENQTTNDVNFVME